MSRVEKLLDFEVEVKEEPRVKKISRKWSG